MHLLIQPTNDDFAEIYRIAAEAYNTTPPEERNSGFDLFCDGGDVTPLGDYAILVSQGCRAVAVDPTTQETCAFWLAPRSSISRTPWRLANSLGLMDANYRGVVKAALSNLTLPIRPVFSPELNRQRLCQLTTPDLRPWTAVHVVAELPVPGTLRGEGGFGSTGR